MNQLRSRMDIAVRFLKTRRETYHAMFLTEQLKLLDRVLGGEKYLAATFYIPGEITALFGIPVLYIERTAGFAAANKVIQGLVARRLKSGMPACGCTYQLMFEYLIEEGIIPPPAGFLAASFACDDAYMYCMAASSKYRAPLYMVDVMRFKDEESLRYLSINLNNLYNNLKSRVEQTSSIEEVVRLSNAAIAIKNKIDVLRTDFPGIMESSDSFRLFTLYNDLGRIQALNIFNELYETLKKKTAGYGLIQCPRLLWLGLIPLYNNGILSRTEQRYNCRIVYEELFDFGNTYISADNFFSDLSKRITLSNFFSLENRIHRMICHIKNMKIDGIVCFSQHNCRFLPPMLPVIRKRLENIGIPLVEINGDAIDPDYFNESRYWSYMDVFFEMIGRRNRMWM